MAKGTQFCFERREKKYILTPESYSRLMGALKPHLRSDAYPRSQILNIYYDTDDYSVIRASIEKPVYKEKLRLRSYGVPADNGAVFAELKKKFDGIVYKRRCALTAVNACDYLNRGLPAPADGQIMDEIDYFLQSVKPLPKVFIGYDRTSYAGIADPALRVTFDTNLRWRTDNLDLRKGASGILLAPQDFILMEIKIPGAAPVWLSQMLSRHGIFPSPFSKYGTWYKQQVLGAKIFDNIQKGALYCA